MTGMLSPVTADSSTDDLPSITIPSAAADSPGFIINISPVTISLALITCSIPSLITVAVLGARSISFVTASLVLLLERVSRNFPTVIRVKIIPADSKYKSWLNWFTAAISPCPSP